MRVSGILLPLSSLPSPYGIGTLGRAAYDFVDFLAAAGQALWQILPVGPTGYGDSPYQSFSAMAGNPYLIDLDLLAAEGLLLPGELPPVPAGHNPALVEYGHLFETRFATLAKAAARQNKAAPDYMEFCREHAAWLDDYALFMAIKEAHGQAGFWTWPEPLRLREAAAMKAAEAQWGPRVEFWRCLQFFFYRQWRPLKAYANAQGVKLVGDIPIYVSPDSSELWARPELFLVGADGRPSVVAGVPPDAFSATGQLWGNPLYNWRHHKRTKYAWWLARLRCAATLFDVTRIDHFRGFAGYYAVPAQDRDAMNGVWCPGPGKDFIRAVHRALPGMEIIAEDLGFLTEDVYELLAYSGYPGMKVLQFAFDGGAANTYLPHNHVPHSVVYTGTHDNATTAEWARTSPRETLAFARRYLGLSPRQNLAGALVRSALASTAETAVVPLQDWLNLGAEARMNIPATLGGRNWRWRLLPGQAGPELAAALYEAAATYDRLSPRARRLERKQRDTERAVLAAQNAPRVLTAREMKQAEDAANAAGVTYARLMENAGEAAAQELMALPVAAGRAPSVLFLCGRGNNAGDAFVVARLLAEAGWRAQVLLLCGEALAPLARANFEIMPVAVQVAEMEEADFGADVLVDGVFGTGFRGLLPRPVQAAFEKANAAAGLRVALDVPSGLDCDTGAQAPGVFRAGLTLAFGALKPALVMEESAPVCGEVRMLDIGL